MRPSLITAGVVATLMLAAAPAFAQSVHIRGDVAAIAGDKVTMRTTSGQSVDVTMAPDYGVVVYEPITIDAVKKGDYLSIPAMAGADGAARALAVNVFPEALRGRGEGDSPWDIAPASRMINATVGTMTAIGANHELTVSYKGTEHKVSVPEGTPVTRFAPEPGRKLAVGEKVVLFAQGDPSALTASRAGVSADGALPPI